VMEFTETARMFGLITPTKIGASWWEWPERATDDSPQDRNPDETLHAHGVRMSDPGRFAMVIRTIVAVAFFVVCAGVMGKILWMLDQCVPSSKDELVRRRARRWKAVVAAVVVGAWICAGCIALGLDMPKTLSMVVFLGPFLISFPVLVWVLLVY
jgi:hypothetical protein